MIEYISGRIDSINPAAVVIEAGGIGYQLNISLTTFAAIEHEGSARLLVHEVLREDSHQLYGFHTAEEREIFVQLIGVSGIGANTARMILSSLTPSELAVVITSGDHTRLKNVKGIGTKTAQRVIVDLRDKIKPAGETLIQQSASRGDVFDEALAALVMLGFPKPASQKVLGRIFDADPLVKVEAAIKKALAMM